MHVFLMYISCISLVRNNLHISSIFIEEHTTIHEVICHFINRNIVLGIKVLQTEEKKGRMIQRMWIAIITQ